MRGVPPGATATLTRDDQTFIDEVVIAKEFGWTLREIRELGSQDYGRVTAIIAGMRRARAKASQG